MKVALLTMFNDLDPTYSLVNVVAEQLRMLLDHEQVVKLLVCEDCPLESRYGIFLDERIEWVFIVNHIHNQRMIWHDYSHITDTLHPSFSEETQLIAKDFIQALQDVDVCILHDILFQGWHYVHNIAIRLAQKQLEEIRFISFIHSLPLKPPSSIPPAMCARFMPMKRTLFAYPTYSALPLLAKQYQIPQGDCRVVYNSLSLLSFLCPEVSQLHQSINLLDAEFLIVYPGRLTPSKQFEKVAAFAGTLHTVSGHRVKVIFCDFSSLDISVASYKALIRETALRFHLPSDALYFTSDYGFEKGFPRQGVLDLFTLSNIFVCPSFSESFGLTVLEAASRGNFLILNENVPALYELGTKLNAYFMRWNGRDLEHDLLETYKPSEEDYYVSHAKKILNILAQNTVIYAKTQVRTHYNTDWIWHHQLEPLLQSVLRLD